MTDNEPWRFWMLLGPLVLAAAAFLCAVLCERLRPMLLRHALARPNSRSSHRDPTPQGGGIGVIAAVLGVALLAVWGSSTIETNLQFWLLLAAATFIAAVGMIDDVRSIDVVPRLLLQVIAVAVVVAFLPEDMRLIERLPVWLERALLVLSGTWFINIANFMDGMDWMMLAEIVPIAAALVLLGMMNVLPAYAVLIAIALLGAMLGFAPMNQPVARLFLGDVGSLPIGLLTGGLLLLLAMQGHWAAALLLPLYFVADATITLFMRLFRREQIWQAHRSHFYQRAFDRGMPVYNIVGAVFAVNLVLAALAVASIWWPTQTVALLTLCAGALIVAGLLALLVRGPV